MNDPKDLDAAEIYDLVLGNRLTLIALLEILEEKGLVKKDDVFARVLEGSTKEEKEHPKTPRMPRAA